MIWLMCLMWINALNFGWIGVISFVAAPPFLPHATTHTTHTTHPFQFAGAASLANVADPGAAKGDDSDDGGGDDGALLKPAASEGEIPADAGAYTTTALMTVADGDDGGGEAGSGSGVPSFTVATPEGELILDASAGKETPFFIFPLAE